MVMLKVNFFGRHKFATLFAAMLAIFAVMPTLAEVSFEKDLMPILKYRCGACHITGSEPGKMALVPGKAYDFIVNVKADEVDMLRIAPGEPDKSYLLHKLQGTHLDVGGIGSRMPLHQGPLKQKHLDKFRQWIADGAKNN